MFLLTLALIVLACVGSALLIIAAMSVADAASNGDGLMIGLACVASFAGAAWSVVWLVGMAMPWLNSYYS